MIPPLQGVVVFQQEQIGELVEIGGLVEELLAELLGELVEIGELVVEWVVMVVEWVVVEWVVAQQHSPDSHPMEGKWLP